MNARFLTWGNLPLFVSEYILPWHISLQDWTMGICGFQYRDNFREKNTNRNSVNQRLWVQTLTKLPVMYSIIERVKLCHDIDGNVLMSSAFRGQITLMQYITQIYICFKRLWLEECICIRQCGEPEVVRGWNISTIKVEQMVYSLLPLFYFLGVIC